MTLKTHNSYFGGNYLNRRNFISNERGLTLVEIIVVVVILGFLIAFLVPKIAGKGEEAKANVNKLRMQSLQSSISQFRLQYSQLPASLDDLTRCTERTGQGCIPVAKADETKDIWNTPFAYSLAGDGRTYTLKTLGADKRDGGEGPDYDVSMTGP